MEYTDEKLSIDELTQIVGGLDSGAYPRGASTIEGRAEAEIGKPYQWGTVGPEFYDASGFVSYCLTGTHTRIGTTYTFLGWPRSANPQPGDVCVSETHCGIYVGDGSMIHAPGPGQLVTKGPVQGGMVYVRSPL